MREGILGGPYRDRGRYARGALEDEGTPPPCEEGGNPVDHVGGYVSGEEEGPKPTHVDVVEASFYVEEEGGYFQEGPLEDCDFMGEGGHRVRGAEAGEGATLVWVESARMSCQRGEPDGKDAFDDLEMVLRRTMIRKEDGVSYDGLPGLSRTTPFACLSVVGWYPMATSGARRSRRRLGLVVFTFFQTKYGTPSGPGAEEGEDLARAAAISSLVRGTAKGCQWRQPRVGSSAFGGKKWSRRALLISTGELAPGISGNRGVLRGVTNFFAVQILWGVVLARKSVQWEFLAFFIALKYLCLESWARLMRVTVRCFFANLQALAYSLRRAVRAGVHQGFDLGEGREVGVWRRIISVRVSRE